MNILNHFINEHLRRLMVMGIIETDYKQTGEIKETLKLAGRDFNRNVKTVERDMQCLTEMFGVEYSAGELQKQFTIKDIRDYRKAVQQLLAFLELRNYLNTKPDIETKRINNQKFPIRTISNLLIGVLGCRPVNIDYYSVTYNKNYQFRLYPYEIIQRFNKWLLIAYNPGIGQFRQYQIHGITNVLIYENEEFERDEMFRVEDFYRNSFFIYSNNKSTREFQIKIEAAFVNKVLTDFHLTNYSIIKNKDNSIILKFYSDSINEVVNWVFTLHNHVKIIAPKFAISVYIKKLKAELTNYK